MENEIMGKSTNSMAIFHSKLLNYQRAIPHFDQVMWLTPLFYAVLTFRTLRQLFQQDVRGKTERSEGDKETNQNQRKHLGVVTLL